MALPQFQNDDKDFQLMQNSWAAILNPVLAAPTSKGLLLTQIALSIGSNVVNHKLSRKLQGWVIVGVNAAAVIYDAQATNTMPDKTLILISDANCIVNLWVF